MWAWQVAPAVATRTIDDAAAAADGCEFSLLADHDTDGDGDIDAGAEFTGTAADLEHAGWTGVAIGLDRDGTPVTATRYVHRDGLVPLVVLESDDGAPDAPAVVDGYLEDVAAAL
ncbi:hypothetical protein ACI797_09715 [Geodermatophilus sp. SYSU D00691]